MNATAILEVVAALQVLMEELHAERERALAEWIDEVGGDLPFTGHDHRAVHVAGDDDDAVRRR